MLPNITQQIINALLIAVGLILLWLVLLSLRQRIIARLGLRNIPRRPGQTALIVLGLTLSTIIIVSSLALGDTLTYSIRQQAVDAYGQIDEVLSPPLLGTLTELGISLGDNPQATTDETADGTAESGQSDLLAGGLTSVLALFSDGLPGISQERYAELEKDLADEPLVDGVAPSILFPIIIRNRDTGQGEPLGFLFAIDDAYEQQFALRTVQGEVADMETLRPGVGNVFELAANLFATANQTTRELATEFGFEPVDVSGIVLGAAAVGVALTNATADNTTPNNSLEASEAVTNNIDMLAQQIGVDSATIQNLLDNVGLNAADLDLQSASSQFLDVINLNTLGDDIDRALEQLGLELRHGEVYLNRVGAETLNARPGDLLDVYIGPIPLPYRVADIVEQAGPAAALFPTVVMPLAEAQRLLFMEERINSVLISNQGDALEGLALTNQVNKQLRSLSLSEQAVDEVMATLRADDVRPQVERQINREMSRGFFDGGPDGEEDDEGGPPAIVQDFIQENFGVGDMDDNLRQLQAALDGTDNATPELRKALADRQVQFWLNDEGLVGLSAERQAQLSQSVSQLNELDVLEPLSKQTVVNAAAVGGTAFTGVFSLFGFFSILAGIILIVMIFVMLAAERRSELGMARAIGMQRGQVVQMFVTEGLIYDLIAAAIGVALGLAVSYAMVGFIGGLFNNVAGMADEQINGANLFRFRFTVIPSTIIIGYCLGVLFTFAVVTFASYRVSRLNIIAAIRDLPESSFSRKTSRWGQLLGLISSLLLIIAGIYVILSGTGDVMTTLTDIATGQMALTGLELELTRTLLGATLLITGIAYLLGQILRWRAARDETRQRVVYSIIGIGLLVLWVTPWYRVWSLFFGESQALFQQDPALVIISFVISGPLIILGAILAIMYNANSLIWIINGFLRVLPRSLSSQLASVLRTAIAYPLNARFRTGMAMLLFSMIIATVVIMSVVIQATQTVIEPNSESSAGFEIQVDPTLLSLFNPTENLAEEMSRLPDFPTEKIQAVGQVSRQQADITELRADGSTSATQTNLTGVNDGYLQQAQQYYTFQMRAPGYETDADIWEALRTREDVAVVNQGMVALNAEDLLDRQEFDDYLRSRRRGRGGPDDGWRTRLRWLPGFTLEDETMPLIELDLLASQDSGGNLFTGILNGNPATEPITVQVIGVLSDQSRLIDGSVQVNDRLLTRLMGVPVTPERFYVKAMPDEDVRAVAQAVEGAFVSGGLNATVIAEAFAAGQAVTRGVLQLFQGFLALGLLVGMAALGVISSRAVVERRQQVGMLRAIGYQSNMVAFSFVLEASFIALCGLGIGTLTGVALGQNVVGELFSAISGETIPIPWRQIGSILALAYAISLLTTILPALQAARIYPAEALRYD